MAAPLHAQTISAAVPPDYELPEEPDFTKTAFAYADFAWQTFLAINWPAATGSGGKLLASPDPKKNLTKGNHQPTVWEGWFPAAAMFLPEGAKPAAWGSAPPLPEACAAVSNAAKARFVLSATTKTGTTYDDFDAESRLGPVIDRNGNHVRVSSYFNKPMYDYIVANRLYSRAGQEEFVAANPAGPSFPRGEAGGEAGAIMVMAAWRILTDKDNDNRFHTAYALIHDPDPAGARCALAQVGMIAMHVTQRTPSAPHWTWATFEHVANAPEWPQVTGARPLGKSYAFYDVAACEPAAGGPACAYNVLPPQPWHPGGAAPPTTVVRLGAMSKIALALNIAYRKELAPAAWSNYQLIDVQWPTRVVAAGSDGIAQIDPLYPDGAPSPSYLANPVLETYIQGFAAGELTGAGRKIPPLDHTLYAEKNLFGVSGGARGASGSCAGCHSGATMAGGAAANFVYALNRAR